MFLFAISGQSPPSGGYAQERQELASRRYSQFLNGEVFYTLKEAQILTERWRTHYTRSAHTAVSGASHPFPKQSSLRAED